MQRTERVIEINAPIERVFDLFSDFESFPRWMSHIKEVRYTGRRYTRWTAEAPLGSSVEWEAQTTAFEPDRRIAWRSVRGDVETEGEVVFQETARGTTLMRVVLGYDPPAGRLGALVARLFGTNPEEQLEEDLERFALVAEGPRRSHRTRAPRRDLDDVEDEQRQRRVRHGGEPVRMYDGAAQRDDGGRVAYERRADDERVAHAPRHDSNVRGREWQDRDRGYYEIERFREDDRSGRERRGRRFDAELREALRSQRESMQRYDEERRREADYETARRRPLMRAEGRGPADERRLYEGRMRESMEDDRRSRPSPSRYALTPRERESERAGARKRLDSDYPGRALRRGVDKLMDDEDAPSNRWDRW